MGSRTGPPGAGVTPSSVGTLAELLKESKRTNVSQGSAAAPVVAEFGQESDQKKK